MASDIWWRSTQIAREETRCRHMGCSFLLAARVILYASSHCQDNTYHGLCYTSRGALAGTRNSSHVNTFPICVCVCVCVCGTGFNRFDFLAQHVAGCFSVGGVCLFVLFVLLFCLFVVFFHLRSRHTHTHTHTRVTASLERKQFRKTIGKFLFFIVIFCFCFVVVVCLVGFFCDP